MAVSYERRREQRRESRRRQRQRNLSKGLTGEGKVRQRPRPVSFPKGLLPKPPELVGLAYECMSPVQRKLYNDWQYERHGRRKKAGMKRYRESNPEKRALSQKKWREANKEYLQQYMAKWWAEDPERKRAAIRESQAKRRAKLLADPAYIAKQAEKAALKREKEDKRTFENALAEALKLSRKLWLEELRKTSKWKRRTLSNPILKVRSNIRGRIYRYLKGLRKPTGTMQLIGCTMTYLKGHLESQFKRGMTWENYGRSWHVDHIVPCSYFDLTKPEEIRRCFHFSNLRPLWAKANMQESDRRGPLTPFLGI